MGEVFLARDVELERRVALKILPADLEGDEESIRRFIREAKAASALNHPNILTIYEVGKVDALRYIATEYVHGRTLIIDIAIQIAAALNTAHDNNIIHRDIKPENIMIRDDGLVKILDFGLAKLHSVGPPSPDVDELTHIQVNTERGIVMGTAQYLSPEQARAKEVDSRTDIWSLGVIIYEMIAGKRPFDGETTADVVAGILRAEPEPIRERAGDDLQHVVDLALKKNADERYRSSGDLLRDLKSLRGDRIHASLSSDRGERPIGDATMPTIRIDAGIMPTPQNVQTGTIDSAVASGQVSSTSWTKRLPFLGVILALVAALGIAGYSITSRTVLARASSTA
jgi:serine/threonine protein kinase